MAFIRAGLGLATTTPPVLSPLLRVRTLSNELALRWCPPPSSPPRPRFPLYLRHLLYRLSPAHPCAESRECTPFPRTLSSRVIRATSIKPPSHQRSAPSNEA